MRRRFAEVQGHSTRVSRQGLVVHRPCSSAASLLLLEDDTCVLVIQAVQLQDAPGVLVGRSPTPLYIGVHLLLFCRFQSQQPARDGARSSILKHV